MCVCVGVLASVHAARKHGQWMDGWVDGWMTGRMCMRSIFRCATWLTEEKGSDRGAVAEKLVEHEA